MTTTKLNPANDKLLKFSADTIGMVAGIDQERDALRVFRNGDDVKICYVTAGSLVALLVETMPFEKFIELAN